MKTSTPLQIARLLIGLLIVAQIAAAQSGRGWMHGTVVDDSTSKALPGAGVELIDDQGSVRFNTRTDERGTYSFKSLPMGDYTLRVRLEGYEAFEKKADVLSDALTEIDVRLKKKK